MLPETPNPNPSPNPNPNQLPRIKRPRGPPSPSSSGLIPPCTECGRPFSSMKALFGHMRCHPERQWRGINPPPHFRRQLPALGSFTPDEYDVAASLLLLANGPPKARPKRTPAAAAAAPLLLTVGSTASSWEVDQHRCTVCDRGFSSGQALGGHMRCHGAGAGAGASAAPAGYVLDLNLPPPGEVGGDSTCLDLSLRVTNRFD